MTHKTQIVEIETSLFGVRYEREKKLFGPETLICTTLINVWIDFNGRFINILDKLTDQEKKLIVSHLKPDAEDVNYEQSPKDYTGGEAATEPDEISQF